MDRVCKWAHERILQQDFLVADTETTSLEGEICDLAILGPDGKTIFDSLIKPVGRMTEEARRVHHISDEMLANAPTFAEVWPEVRTQLAGRIVITYNANFDFSMIALSLLSNGMKDDESYKAFTTTEDMWQCLMKRYQQHTNKSRRQKLEIALQQQGLEASNTHRALADAQAACRLLEHLARKYPGSTYEAWQIERERQAVEAPSSTQTVSAAALAREAEIESIAKRFGRKL